MKCKKTKSLKHDYNIIGVKSISSTNENPFVLSLLNDGRLIGFGGSFFGNLGIFSDINTSPILIDTSSIGNVKSISAGGEFTLILTSNGEIFSMGYNNSQQLGINNTNIDMSDKLNKVLRRNGYNGKNCVAISTGAYHSLVLLESGEVLSFGYNNLGQLGNGTYDITGIPTPVKHENGYDGRNCIGVYAGAYSSFILLKNGQLLGFGDNSYGQLGIGNTDSQNIPTKVICDQFCVSASCSFFHSLILLKNGKVLSMGENNKGQLGNNLERSYIPVEINYTGGYDGENAIQVSSSSNSYSAIILKNYDLLTFGAGENYYLGNGSVNDVYSPEKIYENCVSVSCGTVSTTILLRNGKILTYGSNYDNVTLIGCLGDAEDFHQTPEEIALTFEYHSNGLTKANVQIINLNKNLYGGKTHDKTTYNLINNLSGDKYKYSLPYQNSYLKVNKIFNVK
jgi:alpha-tubulin suppressor-like RCC1 family protein